MTKPISRRMAVDALLYRFAVDGTCDLAHEPGMYFLPCAICGEPLRPGQQIEFDHTHADVFDGPHEYKNLRPLHKACHAKKTAKDNKANAKVKRILGETKTGPKAKIPAGRKIPSRPFQKRKP